MAKQTHERTQAALAEAVFWTFDILYALNCITLTAHYLPENRSILC